MYVFLAFFFFVSGLLQTQQQLPASSDPDSTFPILETRIAQWLQADIAGDDKAGTDSRKEVRDYFASHGLPGIKDVGDEASYDFVFLCTSNQPLDFVARVAARAQEQASHLPSDAVLFAQSIDRIKRVSVRIAEHSPTHPALRDQILEMQKRDQFFYSKTENLKKTDSENARALMLIFDKYGVPTFAMVGTEAASDFVLMVQHQPPAFRQLVLPRVRAELDRGQASASTYALIYDRSQTDVSNNQLYGTQAECGADGKFQVLPVDDPAHLDQRRAEIGLVRESLYLRMMTASYPADFCKPKQ